MDHHPPARQRPARRQVRPRPCRRRRIWPIIWWRLAAGAVLTSATLRSLGLFDLLLAQTGRNGWATPNAALESPFDFQRQGAIRAGHAPSPKDAPAHTAEIIQLLPKLIDAAAPWALWCCSPRAGRCRKSTTACRPSWPPVQLVQGSLPKAVLLARHHERLAAQQASVIFGLDSFAEGLDLPVKPACR